MQSPIVKKPFDAALKALRRALRARKNGDLMFFGRAKAKVVNDALACAARENRPRERLRASRVESAVGG